MVDLESLEVECPGCGLPVSQWPHRRSEGAISKDGEYYCCQECLEGRICDCGGERREEKIAELRRVRGKAG